MIPALLLTLALLALLVVARRKQTRAIEALPVEEPERVETIELPTPPTITAADLDDEAQLADLLARHNAHVGGRFLSINVGPSRHERRAEKAMARKTVTDRGKARKAGRR